LSFLTNALRTLVNLSQRLIMQFLVTKPTQVLWYPKT